LALRLSSSFFLILVETLPNSNQELQQQFEAQEQQPNQSAFMVPKKEKTEENFYQCKQCDKKLQSQGGLYHHVQTVHKHFRFFCKLCHQTFTTKKSLQVSVVFC
jgi:C2H2-type zinc finger